MKKFIYTIVIISLSLLSTLAVAEIGEQPNAYSVAIVEPVNLNSASVEQLTALPGIGEKKAQAIVAYRDRIGKFAHIEDLVEVKGIGEKMLEKFKHQITVE